MTDSVVAHLTGGAGRITLTTIIRIGGQVHALAATFGLARGTTGNKIAKGILPLIGAGLGDAQGQQVRSAVGWASAVDGTQAQQLNRVAAGA